MSKPSGMANRQQAVLQLLWLTVEGLRPGDQQAALLTHSQDE